MMPFIEFDANKCDECYRCLRACPTKAIAFTGQKRKVIEERCIKCGICQLQCEKGALRIHLDIDRVQEAVDSGVRVIASLAPSYAGVFSPEKVRHLPAALISLGFEDVEETAVGADLVSLAYEEIIRDGRGENIITSCCPASNYLIEQYYPEALDSVIGIVSPMIAHGRDLRRRWGEDVFIVFIGPCLAKKAEAEEFENVIDAVITFRELQEWFDQTGVDWTRLKPLEPSTKASMRGKAYPLGGSLWRGDLKTRINPAYRYEHVDGIEDCHAFLSGVSNGTLKGFCAELNICKGSCMNGPDLPACAGSYYERISRMQDHIDHTGREETCERAPMAQIALERGFEERSVSRHVDPVIVEEMLAQMGKSLAEDRVNCGACGYSTCYDKAEAVVLGLSSQDMCLDRLRKNAENIRSIIFENSPNAICIIEPDLRLREVNPSFNRMFNNDLSSVRHWPVKVFIDHPVFDELVENDRPIISRKIRVEALDKSVIANLMNLEKEGLYIGIFTDVTEADRRREEMKRVKEETVKTCQEVIDRQMRVVQEIASLLGETAADTKVGLNQLKDLMLNDGGY